jgi:hypothetical protein
MDIMIPGSRKNAPGMTWLNPCFTPADHLDLGDGLRTRGLQGVLSDGVFRSMEGGKVDDRMTVAVDGVAALYFARISASFGPESLSFMAYRTPARRGTG